MAGSYGAPNHGRVRSFADFLGAVINPEFGGSSENAGTAAIVVAQPGGVVGLITGATSTNRSTVTAGLNLKAQDGRMSMEARVKQVSAITARAVFVGWTDNAALENPIQIATTVITSNATDAVGFVYDTSATTAKWFGLAVANDIDEVTLAQGAFTMDGVQPAPAAAGTYEMFHVEIYTDGNAVLSYGADTGSKYGLREVQRIPYAVTPTVLLTPVVLLETRGSAAKTAYVDYIDYSGGRPA